MRWDDFHGVRDSSSDAGREGFHIIPKIFFY